MREVWDAFWRAGLYCLHPQLMWWSLLPMAVLVVLAGGLGYLYFDSMLLWMGQLLESQDWLQSIWSWLESVGAGGVKTILVPLLVIAVCTPVLMVTSLLSVGVWLAPRIVELVGRRRFPEMHRHGAGNYFLSMGWALLSSCAALLALVLTLPLYLIPPFVLVVPMLIWGWLTYRVLAFDALAQHATPAERRIIFHRHRWTLLAMGVFSGYLGLAPALVWSLGLLAVALAPLLLPLMVWLYTLIFVFSSLWFTHFCLHALQAMRHEAVVPPPRPEGSLLQSGEVVEL